MRLHDVQVVLSAVNTADKIQQVNQQQGQLAQSQNAMQMESQAQVKLTQTQQAEHESPSKLIDEKDRRGRGQKKDLKHSKRADNTKPLESAAVKLPESPKGNIIDIKV